MKKVWSLITVSVLCLSMLAACAKGASSSAAETSKAEESKTTESVSTSTGETTEKSEGGKLTIGVSINSNDQFRTAWMNEFQKQAEAKGHTVFGTNADNDASAQISDIESLVQRNPDIIIVHAIDSEGIVPAIEAAKAQDIKVVSIDMETAAEVDSHVMDFQGENGVIQAEYLTSWLDEKEGRTANIGYIVGMYSMEAAMPRMNDFKSIVEKDERCKWLEDKESGWSGAEAVTITEDWIQAHPDMNVFACMSDEMAIGAIQALVAAGKNMDEVVVMGVDGSEAAMEYLKSGQLDCTAARNLEKEITVALDVAEKVCAGETVAKHVEPKAIFAMTSKDVQ